MGYLSGLSFFRKAGLLHWSGRCLLAGSDLFVLASRNEGLPLSVVEAFAAGIPAVLTDTGDCAILTGHGKRGLCVRVAKPWASPWPSSHYLMIPIVGGLWELLREPLWRSDFSFHD